jgi:hypothetical protein
MDWKIFYADETTFSSDDGTWDDAPCDGVIAICVRDEVYGKVVLNSRDFYYQTADGGNNDMYCVNDLGPQLRHRCPWLKFGIGISSDKYKHILARATRDPDFPRSQKPQRRSTDGA